MNWKDYFMKIAYDVSLKSKDPSSKVGCVITTDDNRPVSFGYNGFIAGCDEHKMTHERPYKYYMTAHAEMNAIIFSHKDLRDCHVYCTHAILNNEQRVSYF